MSEVEVAEPPMTSISVQGIRKNGKQWKPSKSAFRPGSTSSITTTSKSSKGMSKAWTARLELRKQAQMVKAREKDLKDEKEAERQRRIQAIKDKRAAKEEKERYELLAAKMHQKRVDRLKRREKRNKALKER